MSDIVVSESDGHAHICVTMSHVIARPIEFELVPRSGTAEGVCVCVCFHVHLSVYVHVRVYMYVSMSVSVCVCTTIPCQCNILLCLCAPKSIK